uniref:Uncharacterized protein n=1 Tax=viral metagenome TaxID=1070528 RepID=A0A6M3KGN2_9ZZZZ
MKKIIKVRRCKNKVHCQYKNVWWDATQCLAEFHIWHTCLSKWTTDKIKKEIKEWRVTKDNI